MLVWAPRSPRERLQAKLVELIEIVSVRQPEKVEAVTRPLEQHSLAGRVEIRSIDLSRHNFNLLQEIVQALDRIEAGTYGTCGLCHGTIEVGLLTATPWAAYCAGCREPVKNSPAR